MKVHDLYERNSIEWYYSGSNQSFINVKSLGALNEKGRKLYDDVLLKVQNQDYKNEFVKFYTQRELSGSWYADPTSTFYDITNKNNPMTDQESISGLINTWNNVCVIGTVANGESLTTSPCIFISDKWCYTSSGSLYKLGTNTSEI